MGDLTNFDLDSPCNWHSGVILMGEEMRAGVISWSCCSFCCMMLKLTTSSGPFNVLLLLVILDISMVEFLFPASLWGMSISSISITFSERRKSFLIGDECNSLCSGLVAA